MGVRKLVPLVCFFLMAFALAPLFSQTRSPFDEGPSAPLKVGASSSKTTTTSTSVAVAPTVKTASTCWVRADMGVTTAQVFCVTQDKANFRSGPGTNFGVIREVTFGNLFPVVSEQGGWLQVALTGLDAKLPKSTPEEVEAAQQTFLASYKTYTQSVLKLGKANKQSVAALKAFRNDYAAYKVIVRNSEALQKIRAGALKTEKIVVSKANFTATVYAGGQIVRVYPIAYGNNPDALNKQKQGDCRTPDGNFKVAGKAVNPPYRVPETKQVIPGGAPNNPFGTRFIGLNTWGGSIGMHGTSNPSSIGMRASHGCMRMFTPDNEELFDLVRVGTPVTVLPVKAG